MCGFIVSINNCQHPNMRDMLNIACRGPDSHNCYRDDHISIDFFRLSINDTENGNQPFFDEDYISVFNGEIINFRELIECNNIRVRSGSDGEVIIPMYKKFGSDFVKELEGMFSLVLINRKTLEFIVAIDRFGVKPLYYKPCKDGMIFSSLPLVDNQSCSGFINFICFSSWSSGYPGYGKYEYTEFGWKRLAQGHIISGGMHGITSKIYFKPFPIKYINQDFLIDDIISSYDVKNQKYGVFVSGGVDSVLLSYLLNKNNKNQVAYTISNPATILNGDLSRAVDFCKNQNINLKVIENEIDKFSCKYMFLLRRIAHPLLNPEQVFKSDVYEKSCGEKVFFSGQGVDEFFGGYTSLFSKSGLWSDFNIILSVLYNNSKSISSEVLVNFWNNYIFKDSVFFDPILNIDCYVGEDGYISYVKEKLDNLFEYNLTLEDRLSGLYGKEMRVPYVDHRMFKIAFNLSDNKNIEKNHYDKHYFRKEAYKFIGKCANQRKISFYYGDGESYIKSAIINMIKEHILLIINGIDELKNRGQMKWIDYEKMKKFFMNIDHGNCAHWEPVSKLFNAILLESGVIFDEGFNG